MRKVGWEKGRAVLVFAAVALLVLPLVGLIVLWNRAPPERMVEGWRFVPWFPPAEIRGLPTLLQSCQADEQCDPQFVCFHDPHYQHGRCTSSDCEVDSWCPTHTACRSIPMRGRRGMAVRECTFEGTRKEGEPCLRFPQYAQLEWACGQGLFCSMSGWCGRRCVPGMEGTCPEGFFCARGDPDGPMCQPTCEGRACPDGQQCIQREGGVSVCARAWGRRCPREPCSGNQVCEAEMSVHVVGEARMRCVQPCGQDGAGECREGSRCHQGRCRRQCLLSQPGSCGPFRFCVSTDDAVHGVCLSSPEQWDMDAGPARDGG